MGLGDRLKEERERLGFNQTDFAALGHVSKNSQFNYEKGERSPDADYLAAMAEAGVDVLYVLTGQRTPVTAAGLAEDEGQVLNNYRAMPDSDRASVRRLTTVLAEAAGAYRVKQD